MALLPPFLSTFSSFFIGHVCGKTLALIPQSASASLYGSQQNHGPYGELKLSCLFLLPAPQPSTGSNKVFWLKQKKGHRYVFNFVSVLDGAAIMLVGAVALTSVFESWENLAAAYSKNQQSTKVIIFETENLLLILSNHYQSVGRGYWVAEYNLAQIGQYLKTWRTVSDPYVALFHLWASANRNRADERLIVCKKKEQNKGRRG